MDTDDWLKQGQALFEQGDYEGAIACYESAINIDPKNHETCFNRGKALYELTHYKAAISSYDRAIQLKSDFYQAWNNKGLALRKLDRFAEAIASYNQAIQFKPDGFPAYNNRGLALNDLDRHEEAISSYDRAIQLKPDCYQAWNNRGLALNDLDRHEEAISSYDRAIQSKPDFYVSWSNRGYSLNNLGRFEGALTNCDKALRLSQNQWWQAWKNRGLAILGLQGYKAALAALDEGLTALLPTTPDYQYACGELYRIKGQIQYREGSKQPIPFPDWDGARKSYLKTLEFWTFENPQFTQLHLEVLQELTTVCTYLFSTPELNVLLEEATAKLQRVLQNPELTLGQKITLEAKFSGFNQLQVINLAQQNPTQALELAEARKNRCLGRLRDGWSHQPSELTYAQIQTLLTSGTAIIYWHLSPAALTTFILTPGQSPQVFQPKSSASAKQLQEFEDWMKQWKQTYQQHRDLDSEAMQSSPWRQNMEFMLYNRLRKILDINNLWQNHLKNIDQLIFIPHRKLHLLPLHTLFPSRFTITYLPSAQLGLDLQHHTPSSTQKLLSIEDPATQNFKPKTGSKRMLYAELESTIITTLYQNPSPTRIKGTQATQINITEALKNAANCFHFTGHSYHNLDEPLNSALALSGQDILTLKEIFALDLHPYNLVCLSACETGITSTQDILDEYIGLVSGFLSAGAAHVISTLWTVDEISSSLLMIQFHQFLKDSFPPAKALSEAQQWLRNLTYEALIDWYQKQADKIDPGNRSIIDIITTLAKLTQRKAEDERKFNHSPYAHPFYWAGFTITGKVPNEP